jgi:hypothetical protein
VLQAKGRQPTLQLERRLAQEHLNERCTYMYAANTCCYLSCHQLGCRLAP